MHNWYALMIMHEVVVIIMMMVIVTTIRIISSKGDNGMIIIKMMKSFRRGKKKRLDSLDNHYDYVNDDVSNDENDNRMSLIIIMITIRYNY